MKRRNIIIVLLVLPYLPLGAWLAWHYLTLEDVKRIDQMERQRVAQFPAGVAGTATILLGHA
jgi:hypothetical protein